MKTQACLVAAFLACCLVAHASCSCDVRIAVRSGEEVDLTSPNYPSNFSSQVHCFYDLTTELTPGDVLHVTVLDVTLTCDDPDSSLEVFDAFSTSAMYLGKICAGGVVTFASPRERLYLVFKSQPGTHGQATSRGFKLAVRSSPDFRHCYNATTMVLPVLSLTQHLISPYYPLQVAQDAHCRWLLKAPQEHRVHVDILYADMRGSDNCANFGLYIYDGKTHYDDKKLATICSNGSQSFCSTSNYMMIVFTSGTHVLHSGGGVKLGYYSALAESQVGETDSSLLYILVGVLLGLATFTIIMVVLRFVVIPARMQALARRYSPGSTTRPRISPGSPSDPPPPYEATGPGRDGHKWASICSCCFLHDKTGNSLTSRVHSDADFVLRNTPFAPGHMVMPQILTDLTRHSIHTGQDFLEAGTRPPADTPGSLQSRNAAGIPSSCNDYQELPEHGSETSASGTEVMDNEANEMAESRFPSEREARYDRVDSGYHESVLEEDGHSNYVVSIGNNTAPCTTDSTTEEPSVYSSSLSGCDSHAASSTSAGANGRRDTVNDRDNDGYEVPVSLHPYDSLSSIREDDEDGGEGVYHQLQFDVPGE